MMTSNATGSDVPKSTLIVKQQFVTITIHAIIHAPSHLDRRIGLNDISLAVGDLKGKTEYTKMIVTITYHTRAQCSWNSTSPML
jgi:hypothetical protein